MASVGLLPKELDKRGIKYLTADYPFDDHGKSILMEAKHGYVAVHAEKESGVILGAECVGKDAGELIHTYNSSIFESFGSSTGSSRLVSSYACRDLDLPNRRFGRRNKSTESEKKKSIKSHSRLSLQPKDGLLYKWLCQLLDLRKQKYKNSQMSKGTNYCGNRRRNCL